VAVGNVLQVVKTLMGYAIMNTQLRVEVRKPAFFKLNSAHVNQTLQDDVKCHSCVLPPSSCYYVSDSYIGLEERIEELRETHCLESSSQTQLVDELRNQIQQNEAFLRLNAI